MNRREFMWAASGTLSALATPLTIRPVVSAPNDRFDSDALIRLAKGLAAKPFVAPESVGEPFDSIGYDQYRDIRYKKALAYWLNEDRGFTLEFLHAGFIYKTPVTVYILEDGTPRRIPYSSHLFEFGPKLNVAPIHDRPLFSGFRLRTPLQNDRFDEFCVFQGASYFRALGAGERYGASARGLAVNTAEPEGEEFPLFRTFWIDRPLPHAKSIVIYALLDSPSVTGGFTFRITPGPITLMDIRATLFARKDLEHLGLAPLTSMYLFGPRDKTRFDDYRTAVHDSDSLAIADKAGARLLRSLANPRTLQLSSFGNAPIQAFGLQQRDTSFWRYDDLEARYELRPSTWVEPKEDWEAGTVELVEIPSDREFNDNIVAFWRPTQRIKAGQEFSFSYWLNWGPPVAAPSLANVLTARTGLTLDRLRRLFVIDFSAPVQGGDPPNMDWTEGIAAHVSASSGKVENVRGEPNPFTGGYRTSFEVDLSNTSLSELRLDLLKDGQPISETWLYRWTN